MRKLALLLITGLFTVSATRMAESADLYAEKDVVFYGIDYTYLKLIHDEGFIDKNNNPRCKTLTFKYFKEWNEIFILESHKYNIKELYGFENCNLEMDTAKARNQRYQTEDCIITDDNYTIEESDFDELLKGYPTTSENGKLGMLIVAESLSKKNDAMKFYVIFFDIASHEILKKDFFVQNPGGDGFRNYWISPVHNGLQAGGKAFKKERKAAGK